MLKLSSKPFLYGLLILAFSLRLVAPDERLKLRAAPLLEANLRVSTVSRLAQDPSLKSRRGNEFYVIQSGNVPAKGAKALHRFLVQGGVHGNETGASQFVEWMARRYARGKSLLNTLPSDGVEIDFLPHANPDGTALATRYNAEGVNLNRNFGVLWGVSRENPGQESFSEPETKAIRALFAKREYTAAVDVHGYINWVVGPTAPADAKRLGAKIERRNESRYKAWMAAMRTQMSILPGYQLKTAGGLGDGGAFEDWAFWSQGTLAFCLELETFQRFVPANRPDFSDLTKGGGAPRIDLYKRYEAFVYAMFKEAIAIRATEEQPQSLAGEL